MKKFTFSNLTKDVRNFMLEELSKDEKEGNIYKSKRFNNRGNSMYFSCLKQAILDGDDFTLKNSLDSNFLFKDDAPVNASELFSQSEFNRYYIRGLCLCALNDDFKVRVYRAKDSLSKRLSSQGIIGDILDPKILLEDLRTSIGKSPKILPEVNSGLSIERC